MKYTVNKLNVSGPIAVQTGAPVDSRYVVNKWDSIKGQNYVQLFKEGEAYTSYEGLQVYALDTHTLYILKTHKDAEGKDVMEFEKLASEIDTDQIEDLIDSKDLVTSTTLNTYVNTALSDYAKKDDITGLYKIKEPLDDIDDLHALKVDDVSVGDVHNIRDRFTIEVELSDGGKQLRTYPSGTNVVCFRIDEVDDPTDSTKKIKIPRWDALGGVSEFDWIDITEESEESGSGTDPGVQPTEPTT